MTPDTLEQKLGNFQSIIYDTIFDYNIKLRIMFIEFGFVDIGKIDSNVTSNHNVCRKLLTQHHPFVASG